MADETRPFKADSVNLYWGQASGPTQGWWVAGMRVAPDRVRIIKVLRDGQRDASPEQIMAAAAQAVPEVQTWYRATDGVGRVIGWTGDREEVEVDA